MKIQVEIPGHLIPAAEKVGREKYGIEDRTLAAREVLRGDLMVILSTLELVSVGASSPDLLVDRVRQMAARYSTKPLTVHTEA